MDFTSGPNRQEAIFHRGLSTEAVSLYLLCCGLVDAGLDVTHDTIAQRWNAGMDQLAECLQTLVDEGIFKPGTGAEGQVSYSVTPPDHWRRMG